MIKVYIASPYTNGDVGMNVKLQLDVADKLISKGFAPFIPLLYHYQHIAYPRGYDDWMKLDLEWLRQCDCLLISAIKYGLRLILLLHGMRRFIKKPIYYLLLFPQSIAKTSHKVSSMNWEHPDLLNMNQKMYNYILKCMK